MKIAILGGSFNPVHIGHLALADDVCKSLCYDKVLFVPVYVPPHKQMSCAETPEHRIAMLQRAFKNDSRFEVEPCEIERKGISYTVDTVHYLMEKYKGIIEGKFGLIMGQENAAEFDKWKGAEKLASVTDIIIARRVSLCCTGTSGFENRHSNGYTGGFDNDDSLKISSGFKHDFIELKNLVLPVSSTEIRARIANNFGWRYLVPDGVFEYILKYKLYGCKN